MKWGRSPQEPNLVAGESSFSLVKKILCKKLNVERERIHHNSNTN